MANRISAKRVYLQPSDMILNGIHDLAELQKAETVMCDTSRGKVRLRVTLFAKAWEYSFTIIDLWSSRCTVVIELSENAPEAERMISHEFALLDYVLIDRAEIEFADQEQRIVK